MDTVIVNKKGGMTITYRGDFEFTGNYVILHAKSEDGLRTVHTVMDLTWIENIDVQKQSEEKENTNVVPSVVNVEVTPQDV